MPVPANHVLMRAFYLIDDCPGALPQSRLWIERSDSTAQFDGVARLLVGQGGWASAWQGLGKPARQEAATRCGVNAVLYALVGNYKADQIHAPAMIERLGTRGGR